MNDSLHRFTPARRIRSPMMRRRTPARRPVLIVLHQEQSTAGRVGRLLQARGHALDIRKPRFGDPLPETMREHAGAVIFGGPMGANDPDDFVKTEIDWIGTCLKEDAPFLGICLGAQMMAKQMGARVYTHGEGRAEVGYYGLGITEAGSDHAAQAGFAWPDTVYQWHRDGFDCPSGAQCLATGGDFPVQAIRAGSRVYGIQFHPEVTPAMMCRWSVRGHERTLMPGAQLRHLHLQGWYQYDPAIRSWLDGFLDHWLADPVRGRRHRMSRSVLVLGAGMVGVSCALALQTRGLPVTLIDRREPGRETSYGNAGVLARSSIVPLNNPGLYGKLKAYLGNRHPALNLDWRRALTRPGWLLRFLWEARPSQGAARIAALDSLTADTVARHRVLMQASGVSHRLRETGTLKLWRGEDGHAAARAEHDFLARHGIASQVLDRQGISGVEPALKPIFPAGLLIPSNGSVDSPGAVTQAYADLFEARGGRIVQAEVTALAPTGDGWQARTKTEAFDADLAIVALGPWSGGLLKPLGIDPWLDVERGYHRHLAPLAGAALSRPVYDVDAAYFMAPMEQGYRVTSGVDLSLHDAADAHRQIDAVTASAREALPLGEAIGDTWRGARPTLPDSLPMIGEAPRHPGLWFAFGNQHIGFSTGPITGDIVAALICGDPPPVDPAPFRPGRYIR